MITVNEIVSKIMMLGYYTRIFRNFTLLIFHRASVTIGT